MNKNLQNFIEAVNFRIGVAVRQRVPTLEIVSALEKIASELDNIIERKVNDADRKKET